MLNAGTADRAHCDTATKATTALRAPADTASHSTAYAATSRSPPSNPESGTEHEAVRHYLFLSNSEACPTSIPHSPRLHSAPSACSPGASYSLLILSHHGGDLLLDWASPCGKLPDHCLSICSLRRSKGLAPLSSALRTGANYSPAQRACCYTASF
eukprot:IDg9509t1